MWWSKDGLKVALVMMVDGGCGKKKRSVKRKMKRENESRHRSVKRRVETEVRLGVCEFEYCSGH